MRGLKVAALWTDEDGRDPWVVLVLAAPTGRVVVALDPDEPHSRLALNSFADDLRNGASIDWVDAEARPHLVKVKREHRLAVRRILAEADRL